MYQIESIRGGMEKPNRELWQPPRLYLAAIESAHRPGASPNERLLAHIIDALLVLVHLLEAERRA